MFAQVLQAECWFRDTSLNSVCGGFGAFVSWEGVFRVTVCYCFGFFQIGLFLFSLLFFLSDLNVGKEKQSVLFPSPNPCMN